MDVAERAEHMTVPRISFPFMILEHYLLGSLHDLAEAEKKLADLEALKEFADAGYTRITDYDAKQMASAGLFWVRGAIESPGKAASFRELANQMLALLSP